MAMTNRERFLAILDGKMPDRIPWIPPISLWYSARLADGDMPVRFQGMSMREVERALGLGHRTGMEAVVAKPRYSDMEVRVVREPGLTRTHYITPLGSVVYGRTTSDQLKGKTTAGYHNVHPIKTVQDIHVWDYVAEHTYYEPTYQEYLSGEEDMGDDGYPLVRAGGCRAG